MEAQVSGLAGLAGLGGGLVGLGGQRVGEEGAERSSGVGCVGVLWKPFRAHSRPFPC